MELTPVIMHLKVEKVPHSRTLLNTRDTEMLFVVLKNDGPLVAQETDHTQKVFTCVLSQDCSLVINS